MSDRASTGSELVVQASLDETVESPEPDPQLEDTVESPHVITLTFSRTEIQPQILAELVRKQAFDKDINQPLKFGRDPKSDIVLEPTYMSRNYLELHVTRKNKKLVILIRNKSSNKQVVVGEATLFTNDKCETDGNVNVLLGGNDLQFLLEVTPGDIGSHVIRVRIKLIEGKLNDKNGGVRELPEQTGHPADNSQFHNMIVNNVPMLRVTPPLNLDSLRSVLPSYPISNQPGSGIAGQPMSFTGHPNAVLNQGAQSGYYSGPGLPNSSPGYPSTVNSSYGIAGGVMAMNNQQIQAHNFIDQQSATYQPNMQNQVYYTQQQLVYQQPDMHQPHMQNPPSYMNPQQPAHVQQGQPTYFPNGPPSLPLQQQPQFNGHQQPMANGQPLNVYQQATSNFQQPVGQYSQPQFNQQPYSLNQLPTGQVQQPGSNPLLPGLQMTVYPQTMNGHLVDQPRHMTPPAIPATPDSGIASPPMQSNTMPIMQRQVQPAVPNSSPLSSVGVVPNTSPLSSGGVVNIHAGMFESPPSSHQSGESVGSTGSVTINLQDHRNRAPD